MRVTEELDAMRVMGISHGFRLIMPRVIALAVCMPLLVAWTDVLALAGGIIAARMQLGISPTSSCARYPTPCQSPTCGWAWARGWRSAY